MRGSFSVTLLRHLRIVSSAPIAAGPNSTGQIPAMDAGSWIGGSVAVIWGGATAVAGAEVVIGCGVTWTYATGEDGCAYVRNAPTPPASKRIRPMIRISSL